MIYGTPTGFTFCGCKTFRNLPHSGADPGGGGPGPPLSENLGIYFYSGFRIFFHAYTFIVASEKKTQRGGGVQLEIL